MANNLPQFRRTSTTGLGPNTTNSANNAYIPAGSFAINLTDKKVFSSDGTNSFEVGANLSSFRVGGSITGNSTYLTIAGSANLVINTGTKIIDSTGSQGSAGQVLTSNGAGNVYWSTPSGGPGGSFTLTTVEVNVGGSPARRSGSFDITSSGLTSSKPVMIMQAVGPYTGKGTLADEAEMDQLLVTGYVTNTTTIRAYWTSNYDVRGNIKFNYIVGA